MDLEGSLKSIEGARLAGIDRFVQVSAIDVDDPLPDDTDEVWRAYVEAKRDADAALRETTCRGRSSGRVGSPTSPATGLVSLGPDVERGDVTRADVAAVVAAVSTCRPTVGKQWNLVNGDTPVADAVRQG